MEHLCSAVADYIYNYYYVTDIYTVLLSSHQPGLPQQHPRLGIHEPTSIYINMIHCRSCRSKNVPDLSDRDFLQLGHLHLHLSVMSPLSYSSMGLLQEGHCLLRASKPLYTLQPGDCWLTSGPITSHSDSTLSIVFERFLIHVGYLSLLLCRSDADWLT